MNTRRAWFIFLGMTFLILTLFGIVYASPEDYPNRPIEMIITFPPGGPLDTTARIIQLPLQKALGVQIILTTKAGVSGALGTDFVAKAKPDGYTLGVVGPSSIVSGPAVNPSLPYKYTDLIPICLCMTEPMAFISKVGAPWKNLDELVNYGKKNPGILTYGDSGYGGLSFFQMELFKLHYGLDIVPVHFRGSGPSMIAALGGHVDLTAGALSSSLPQVKAGKIILLAIAAEKRLADFPDVPTLSEIGLKEAMSMWIGLVVPKECPNSVVEKLGREMEKIMEVPEIITQFEKEYKFNKIGR